MLNKNEEQLLLSYEKQLRSWQEQKYKLLGKLELANSLIEHLQTQIEELGRK